MAEKSKIIFIVNPISGATSKAQIPLQIHQLIDKVKYDYQIVFTDYAGQATEIAAEAAQGGTDIIVAAGGDGTINEIGKAIVHSNSALAILPVGSGNGLARHMKIPLDIAKAIAVINQGKIITIDAGIMNDHVFFCTAGVGFDAHVGSLFAKKTHRGLQGYISTTIKEFFSYKPEAYRLDVNEEVKEMAAFLITFANASQYGNDAYIAPQADIQDGLIDICILAHFPFYKVPMIGWKVFNKKILSSSNYTTIKIRHARLHRPAEGMAHVDGEPVKMGMVLEIKSLPRCLKLVAP